MYAYFVSRYMSIAARGLLNLQTTNEFEFIDVFKPGGMQLCT